MSGEMKITHKELLTFSNLTNLDWHFAMIDPDEVTDSEGNIYYEYKKLKDLLTPDVFQRIKKDEKGNDIRKYIYGTDENGKYDKELGLFEMRQKAGIAMEYLEKWQEYEETGGARGTDEGSFLQDWEVIYAVDNYKAIADYLDYKKNKKAE